MSLCYFFIIRNKSRYFESHSKTTQGTLNVSQILSSMEFLSHCGQHTSLQLVAQGRGLLLGWGWGPGWGGPKHERAGNHHQGENHAESHVFQKYSIQVS